MKDIHSPDDFFAALGFLTVGLLLLFLTLYLTFVIVISGSAALFGHNHPIYRCADSRIETKREIWGFQSLSPWQPTGWACGELREIR